MKYHFLAALLLIAANHSLAFDLEWGTGINESSRLILKGNPTTAGTFTNSYELRLMNIGVDPAPFSDTRGYKTFLIVDIGTHNLTEPGTIQHTISIPNSDELYDRHFLPVLYEKTTQKHFFLSETINGDSIQPFIISDENYDPTLPPGAPKKYYPTSTTGFHKGAEIPPFCGWLSKYSLTENDLTSIPTNLVNLAFAVNANPTNFSGIALAITNMTVSPTAISGGFTLNAKDSTGTPTAVTKLNDPSALVISTTDSLVTDFSTNSALSLSFPTNTFEVNATQDIQFIRLDFTPAEVW